MGETDGPEGKSEITLKVSHSRDNVIYEDLPAVIARFFFPLCVFLSSVVTGMRETLEFCFGLEWTYVF